MLKPVFTKRFEKDINLAKRRGLNLEDIKDVIRKLVNKEILEPKYKDHTLVGEYTGRRECHIESDWLLIYKLTTKEIIFERTGSHTDLFR